VTVDGIVWDVTSLVDVSAGTDSGVVAGLVAVELDGELASTVSAGPVVRGVESDGSADDPPRGPSLTRWIALIATAVQRTTATGINIKTIRRFSPGDTIASVC